MLEKILKTIALSVVSNTVKKKAPSSATRNFDRTERIIAEIELPQSGNFRGFKRHRLSTYRVPGVNEGIEHFRNNDVSTHFEIKKGTPIRLVTKEVSGISYKPFRELCVYVDDHIVGQLDETNTLYQNIVSQPFDKIYVRIEETVGMGKAADGIEVFLFVHYLDL